MLDINVNGNIGSIITQARDLTPAEINCLRARLKDIIQSKTRKKLQGRPYFSTEERIRLIHPNMLGGKILTYLFKNISWEKQKTHLFTRENLANITGKKQSQISRAAKKLISLGLISMHREFFKDTWRFRLVYNLTTEGVWATRWLLKNKTKKRKVR